MPFKSQAQRRKLHATEPEIAERWEREYGHANLPERAPKRDRRKEVIRRRAASNT